MRRLLMTGLFLLVPALVSAQTATPLHRWAWDQSGILTGLSYEVSVDGQAHAPVLGVVCSTGGACNGALPLSLTEGAHTARLRAVRVVDGVRQVSPESDELGFTFVTAPSAPGNLRLQPPQGITIAGTIQQRYPFAGLDVAGAWLDAGAWVYVGAERLSVPDYTVQAGDRLYLSFARPQE